MRTNCQVSRAFLVSAIMLLLLAGITACSVNVKKDDNGQEKKVDIDTPFGGIHVDKNADVRDTGLPVYAGARIKQKGENGEEKSANVNISAGGYGLKVVAVEFESDDPPSKLIAYYKDQLKKYGNVLECHTSKHGANYTVHDSKSDSKALKCDSDDGTNIELKVGTEDNQHIVSIEPQGKGADFALVYVRTRGKEGSI